MVQTASGDKDDEPPTWTTQIVRRDPRMKNELLPFEFAARVGDRILNWLLDRYNTGKRSEGLVLLLFRALRFINYV
jgi:hypothetical protein